MRTARFLLGVLIMVVASGLGVPGAIAQDDGVGFDDLVGLEQQVNRAFRGDGDLLSAPLEATTLREAAKPEVLLLLVAVARYDSAANAQAAYDLLRTDTRATGIDDAPLPLTAVELGLELPHTADMAVETRTPEPVEFLLAVALDGEMTYTVVAITRGADPQVAMTRVLQLVADAAVGSGPEVFDANGASTGGLWDKLPTRGMVDRYTRGVTTVIDEAAFPI